MATHSSVLAWRIPGVGEPGGLLSMGSHRVGHNWSDLAADNSHSNKYEMIPHCGFDLHFIYSVRWWLSFILLCVTVQFYSFAR